MSAHTATNLTESFNWCMDKKGNNLDGESKMFFAKIAQRGVESGVVACVFLESVERERTVFLSRIFHPKVHNAREGVQL